MTRILITGDQGFVGSHFRRRFRDTPGYEIEGVDIKPTLMSDPVDARFFFQNNDEHYDLVLHCAAVVGGRKTIEGEPLKVATDFSIDAEAFQWAARTRPGCFVYFSSSAAYPVSLQMLSPGRLGRVLWEGLISPHDPRLPDESYGWVKLTGEMQCRLLRELGVRVMIVRPFSGYGSDQDESYPMPAIVRRAIRREDPVQIFSNTVRDFIHIDDIVDAVTVAWLEDIDGPFNLCTGVPSAFADIALEASKAVGYKALVEIVGGPRGVDYRVGSTVVMKEFYTPKISVEEGIERMVKELS